MSWLYRHLARPVLFGQDPEEIHNWTLAALARVSRSEILCDALQNFLVPQPLPVELFGLRFPNPIGLAAGMDKHGEAASAWEALGFGFTELGAVTWLSQPGNPSPRVFRVVSEQAIVNRMGFNNRGAERLSEVVAKCRSAGRWPRHPVGVNLGKSRVTPLSQAAEDYARSMRVLLPHLDFFVVNVSSPNTPNLRQLQDKNALDEILAAIQAVVSSAPGGCKPILVKVAPDLSFSALDDVLETVSARGVSGIVATNTTISRPATNDPGLQKLYAEAGGLSGRPLKLRSTEVIRHIYRQSRGKIPIIGVGGIFSAEDAWEKILAGASLLQVYTSLVYSGPGVVKRIVSGIHNLLSMNNLSSINEAVGKACEVASAEEAN